MEGFRKFIEDKGVYLVILLSIGIVATTITIVGLRDYGDVVSYRDAALVENDSLQTDYATTVGVNSVSTKKNNEKTAIGETVIMNNEDENINDVIDIENIKNDVKQKDVEIAEKFEKISFVFPIEGEIIKPYSENELVYSNTLREWNIHKGIDIKAEQGTAVKSVADGIVTAIRQDDLYGTTIVVKHEDDFQSVYSNLSTTSMIKIGDSVKCGEVLSGTGNSSIIEALDEPHLHFELLKENKNVNPLEYIK